MNTELLTYSIFIHPKDLKALKQNVWRKRPVNAKLTTQNQSFKVDVLYRGEHIRNMQKKSYQLIFQKSFYGAKEIHLNAEYKDLSLIRNKLSLDFFQDIGVLSPGSSYVLLYLNGTFQGIYLQLESLDEHLLKKRGLPSGSIHYAVNDDANFSLLTPELTVKEALDSGYSRKFGTTQDDDRLKELIYSINLASEREFPEIIEGILDVEKYLKWLVGVICTQNFDGFIQNYALYKNYETELFEISPWDYDGTWGKDLNGGDTAFDYISIDGYNTLTARLLQFEKYRKCYKEQMEEVLSTKFTPTYLEPVVQDLFTLLEPHRDKDPFIHASKLDFEEEAHQIITFIQDRNHFLTHQLKDF
ncbi:spore coat protein H [Bacillus pakistanensis]|uniref:Spore coat protein H n=1 Tax=Rossellomorea pakistanensis TaxID=992288 RepID=A0ABS2NBN7_9BACI|nr:CotH kinase family protein [Bacillus pakistanensis]MBM7585271.1 spore coat protein H [Bacillus pakistanensis]